MNRSETITNLAAALAKAQAEIRPAVKDSENPHFRSRYADLAAVWEACRTALTGNGLAVVQLPQVSERGTVAVETVLLHESGEFIAGTIEIPLAKPDAQGIGSAVTYARRYSLAAVVGIAHPKWDERPILLCQLLPGARADGDDLRAWLDGRIARWWMPDDGLFVDEIPLGPTGKIDKKAIRAGLTGYTLPFEVTR